jgi:hypothetical protein
LSNNPLVILKFSIRKKKLKKNLENSVFSFTTFLLFFFLKEKICENFSISEDDIIISVEGRYPRKVPKGYLLSTQLVIPDKPVLYFFGNS